MKKCIFILVVISSWLILCNSFNIELFGYDAPPCIIKQKTVTGVHTGPLPTFIAPDYRYNSTGAYLVCICIESNTYQTHTHISHTTHLYMNVYMITHPHCWCIAIPIVSNSLCLFLYIYICMILIYVYCVVYFLQFHIPVFAADLFMDSGNK